MLGSRSRKTILTLKTPLLLNSNHLDIKNAFKPKDKGIKSYSGREALTKSLMVCCKVRELCDKPANKYDGNSLFFFWPDS